MMTREDIMRELELLPVWQLRVPLPSQVEAELPQVEAEITLLEELKAEGLLVENILTGDILESESVNSEQETLLVELTSDLAVTLEPQAAVPQLFTHIASEDDDWLFVMPDVALPGDEALLLQNICKAIHIKTKPAEISKNPLDVLKNMRPKLLIAMGESTAQAMLQSTAALDDLRGTPKKFQDIALVATYDLAHLLRNSQDKAKAWDDFCVAMQVLQDMSLQNTEL
jgi:DNA polymerase